MSDLTIRQPAGTHLAEINIARAADDLESARLAEFMANLDRVNAVAERSPGFVWRLKDETGAATEIKVDEDPRLIVNLSVWESPDALEGFVWKTVHKRFYERRGEWFEPAGRPMFAMWFLPEGELPSLDDALARLERLQSEGPSADVFGWEQLPTVALWRSQRCG